MRYAIAAAVVLAGGVAAWLAAETRKNRLVWDHFDVVKHGILYRSGQLNGDQLVDATRTFGIRTVVNFQIPGQGVEYERAICKQMGIDFLNLPMPGDGFGDEAQFREVLKACDDPHRRPVLIHCARGTCRTGAAVALYRYERDGWTVEDVAAEMRRQSYYNGYIPGYVYAMTRKKPARDLFEPEMVFDSNLPPPPPPPKPREIVPDFGALDRNKDRKEPTHVR
jgi:protein tyrosine/serine phosphatase